jgi:hypothetical protein
VVELEPEVLAATAGAGDPAADQAGREVGGALDMPAHGPRVRDGDLGDLAVEDVIGKAAADDLDLGQFGHAGRLVP